MNLSDLLILIIYYLLLFLVILAEHLVLYARWRELELARRAVGMATIMLSSVPLIPLGLIDFRTWGVLLAAFVGAGAILALFMTEETARDRRRRAELIRSHLDEIGDLDD